MKTKFKSAAEPQTFDAIAKRFEFKGEMSEGGNGSFTGVANLTGIMDRGGDVIVPGSFKSALKSFVDSGAILVGHEWDSLPVAMPTDAKDGNDGLVISCDFHSDEYSQRVRTIVGERIEAGKSVALSVGFLPDRDSCAWFETGKALWEHCEKNGIANLDKKSIMAWKGWCRLISGVKELVETSFVTVGMNQGSFVTAVKSDSLEEDPQGGQTFEDHAAQTLGVVSSFVDRCRDYTATKSADNRPLSKARAAEFAALRDELTELLAYSPADETQSDDLDDRAMALRLSLIGEKL